MQIKSSMVSVLKPLKVSKAPSQAASAVESRSNAEPDQVYFSEPGQALAGALLGAAGMGLAMQVAGAGLWSLAGVALGATAGAMIGEKWEPLSYDAKSVLGYAKRRLKSERLHKNYSEQSNALAPLSEKHRIANDPTSDIKRRFDVYDSSLNLTVLLAH